jgi:hypothetical protein
MALLLVVPAALFVTASLLKYELGVPLLYDLFRPIFESDAGALRLLIDGAIIMGPIAALLLAARRTLRIGLQRSDHKLVGTFTLDLRASDLAVGIISLGLITTLGAYLIAENILHG